MLRDRLVGHTTSCVHVLGRSPSYSKGDRPSTSRLREPEHVALSLGDEVIAVTVSYGDPEDAEPDEEFPQMWNRWHPNVPLTTLHTRRRSLAPPIVDYLRDIEAQDRHRRLVVLIPEVRPVRPWQQILHNQRGVVLDRAIRRGTQNVVICRLRFSLSTWDAQPQEPGDRES